MCEAGWNEAGGNGAVGKEKEGVVSVQTLRQNWF